MIDTTLKFNDQELLGDDLTRRFRLIRMLGKGGMGNVYLAEDLKLSRKVAIKAIRSEHKDNKEVRKRIERECLMHASIGVHPNITTLHDKLENDGNIFLLMEYVDGVLLSEVLASRKNVTPRFQIKNALVIVSQIAVALLQIHNNNVIHRDIKPSNIILKKLANGEFQAKLMDFGVARMEVEDESLTQLTTLETTGPGSPLYMAPERFDSKSFGSVCFATDFYSVGVILYEMLSQGPPFQGTMTEIFTGHITSKLDFDLLDHDLSKELRHILKKLLEKQPSERYSSAITLLNDLTAVYGDLDLISNFSHLALDANDDETLLGTDISASINISAQTVLDTQSRTLNPRNLFRQKKVLYGLACLISVVISVIFFSVQHFSTNEKQVAEVPVDAVESSNSSDTFASTVSDKNNEILDGTSSLEQNEQGSADHENAVFYGEASKEFAAKRNQITQSEETAPEASQSSQNIRVEATARKKNVQQVDSEDGSAWSIVRKTDRKLN
jgi:serine/threonine protein kinase